MGQSVKLGEVATFIRGITFQPKDVCEDIEGDLIGCMRTKNVQQQLDLNDVWGLDRKFVKNKNQYLIEGDLLVSTANSWNLVGKACWVPQLPYECSFGGFISVLRANQKMLNQKYLYYWFTSQHIQSLVRSFGQKTTNISNLNSSRCLNLEIPLPPLVEQQRIVQILDKAEFIKCKRELAIKKLDALAQSVFVDMFGNLIKNSQTKVGDFFLINDNKLNIKMGDEEQISFIPMAAVSEITKSIDDIQFRKFKEVKKGYTPIKKRDLIIAKITPCYENGKMALVNDITDNYAFGSTEFHTFRADNPNQLYLLFYYLDSNRIRKGGAQNMKGAAGQRRVPAEYFSKLPFCLPSEIQITKFVKIINKIKFERKIHSDSINSIFNLQHSLQFKTF